MRDLLGPQPKFEDDPRATTFGSTRSWRRLRSGDCATASRIRMGVSDVQCDGAGPAEELLDAEANVVTSAQFLPPIRPEEASIWWRCR
jgi:hypothetical protein